MNEGQAKRESQVSNAFERLNKTVEELIQTTNRTESMLGSVLRDEPNIGEKESADKAKQVPLVDMLTSIENKVGSVVERLNSIQRRLEL